MSLAASRRIAFGRLSDERIATGVEGCHDRLDAGVDDTEISICSFVSFCVTALNSPTPRPTGKDQRLRLTTNCWTLYGLFVVVFH